MQEDVMYLGIWDVCKLCMCSCAVLCYLFLPGGREAVLLLKGRMRGCLYMATGGITTSKVF